MKNKIALTVCICGLITCIEGQTPYVVEVPAYNGTATCCPTPPCTPLPANWWLGVWTDTGINVTQYQRISIVAEGGWDWGLAPDTGFGIGPEGYTDPNTSGLFLPAGSPSNGKRAQLIAYVGGMSSAPTSGFIGVGQYASFLSPGTGRLWLGFNDDDLALDATETMCDNQGSVIANITLGTITAPCSTFRPTISKGNLSAGSVSGKKFTFTCWGQDSTSWSIYYANDLSQSANWQMIPGSTFTFVGGDYTVTGDKVDDNIPDSVTNRFYKLVSTSGGCCSQPYGFMRQKVAANTMNFFANQVWSYPNTLTWLFNGQTLVSGTKISKWNGSSYDTTTWSGSWTGALGGNTTIKPGEGAFIIAPSTSAIELDFIGYVREGYLKTQYASGQSAVGIMIPIRGGVSHAPIGIIPAFGDTIYMYNSTAPGQYLSYTFFGGTTGWSPQEPTINIGQAFFYNAGATWSWVSSNFSACQ